MKIAEAADARQEKFTAERAWDLLKDAESIAVAKGKKVIKFQSPADRDAVLQQVMGPSGNLRAPTLKIGEQFVVGFNGELYQEVFG